MFKIHNLSVLSYAQGFTMWLYKDTSLTLAQITAEGFCNPSKDMVVAGDMMIITGADGTVLRVVSRTSPIVILTKLSD